MNFTGQTALVVGASRGFGRGVVESLLAKEMIVTALARNREDLEDLARKTSAKIIVADAAGEQAAERILSETKPNLLVLSAGTSLDLREVQLQPHLCRRAREATEVASRILGKFALTSGRTRLRRPPQIQYAGSWEESNSENESGAWYATQGHWRTPR